MREVILMEQKKPFELIQHVLSTIILDAVQFFPQNKKKVHSEAHGLLFGMEKLQLRNVIMRFRLAV